ncbi:MAG: hypothetical protein ACRD0O_12310 [Acidimicrobiia bacterium]
MNLATWLKVQWDRALAVVAAAAGLVALFVGWTRASGTVETAHHVPYLISGGLLGIFLLGVGVTLWLSADLRDEWRALHRLDGRLARLEEHLAGGERDGGIASLPSPVGLLTDVREPVVGRAGVGLRAT